MSATLSHARKQSSKKLIVVPHRIWQFFDCITARPQRHGVLIDLGACIAHTKEMAKVSAAINQVIRERLLHPGAQTRDIIEYFVLLIHSLRETQASDVLLSRLAPPIRKYLRSRPDTVSVVVNSLLGNHETFKLLREELDRTKNIKTPFTLEATQISGGGGSGGGKSAAGGGKGRGGADEAEDDTSEEEVDLDDLNWRPRPIDAGPNYRKTGKSDVISMLVSIFDDREGFMQALERTMAEQLLSIKGYQHDEQVSVSAYCPCSQWAERLTHGLCVLSSTRATRRSRAASARRTSTASTT